MQFLNLDQTTRNSMLAEVQRDILTNSLYLSPRLSQQGINDYPQLLVGAITIGDEATLTIEITLLNRLLTKATTTGKNVPVDSAKLLAEGEFNRFYIRGVCLRAITENGPLATVTVYRARPSTNPRSPSVALVGTTLSAAGLLDDLRTHIGVPTASGIPSGPNSGLSVHL